MFDFNKKTDYGLRLMVFLAKNAQKGPLSLRQIAKQEKLPFKFLEQVVFLLKTAGLVDSKEGKNGGYFLTKNPQKISVAQIVESLEGPVEFGHCFGCPKAGLCGPEEIWAEIGEKVRKTIRDKTLKDLIK
ncbi:Rrf2 family transcriptional regulator [Candidatus Shapirobacteria bacterium]|nr:Rrf2 family transcriptional regulator [Candidatus Shapirobacteria bacterium]